MPFFHEGEAQIQADYGSDTSKYEAMSVEMMRPQLNPDEIGFVGERTFSVAATIDAAHRPWCSPLLSTDGPLFTVPDPAGAPETVRITAKIPSGDPLAFNLTSSEELGVLFFDPSRRRRAKSMGKATVNDDGSLGYEMRREFGLCPKYIFKRTHTPAAKPADATPGDGEVRQQLSAADQAQLGSADTIFYSSYYPGHGADATHRGGLPGFVKVLSPTRLAVPEYFGNGMFNTLGNLVLDPRLGIMTVDFETGRTIHLTGTASWRNLDRNEPSDTATDRRIERVLTVEIDEVTNSTASIGTWIDVEASSANPPVD